MDIFELFVRTLDDLEARTRSDDEYEPLGIAALVRRLFLDGYPLVDQVNRHLRLTIEFKLEDSYDPELSSFPPPSFYGPLQDEQNAATAGSGAILRKLSRDDFFNTVVLSFGPYQFTIKEVVKFQANIKGAVHASKPQKDHARERCGRSITSTVSEHTRPRLASSNVSVRLC